MTAQMQHILEQLFPKRDWNDISITELEEVVHKHPYFSIGQFLLAKKLQTENEDRFIKQSEQTSIYFNKPLWMEWLLESEPKTNHIPINNFTEDIFTEETKTEAIHEPINEPEQIQEEKPVVAETHTVIESPQHIEETPLFESYHTVDYFASQGIKISTEINQGDRLGKQLKSFTEWLRTMKRLPVTEREKELEINEVIQHDIQEFASHSLDEKEVITEAMAEVLLKQNKFDEALEMYEKLSLQDPSKRAYFAGKIEQIKSEFI